MTAITPVGLLRRVHDVFDQLGARDPQGAAADAVVHALQDAGTIQAGIAVNALPAAFLVANEIDRGELTHAFDVVFNGARFAIQFPLLVGPDAIDSFELVRSVGPEAVAGIAYPLPFLEDDIKKAILQILGEPFEQQHSGSELSDIFTPRLRVNGQLVVGAFLLKGRGLAGVLRAKNAGDAGNQITKLARTGATVFVVQHVHEIDLDVRAQLTHAIAYLRSHGYPEAVGSVWDGAETARVLLAYGLLDLRQAQPTILLP